MHIILFCNVVTISLTLRLIKRFFTVMLHLVLLVLAFSRQVSTECSLCDVPPQLIQNCPCPGTEIPSLATFCGKSGTLCSGSSAFMKYVQDLLLTQCSLADPTRCYQPDLKKKETDYIVVGGGSAGSVVTSRLSETPDWEVTLLEAGGPYPVGTQLPSEYNNFWGSSIDWNYPIEKNNYSCLSYPDGHCNYPRGKVMGGTSVINGLVYLRGNRQDYERITTLGNKGWTYDDVLPYFKKSENNIDYKQIFDESEWKYHSEGGLLTVQRPPEYPGNPEFVDPIIQAGGELGFNTYTDPNGNNQTTFTVSQLTIVNGERDPTSKAFLYRPDILNRKNLNIIINAHVTKVLFDKQKRAIGVTYKRNGVKRTLYARKEVILCAGAIASPQLLLLSGVGPKKHLKEKGIHVVADSPGVGQGLHNHAAISIPLQLTNLYNYNRLNYSSLMSFLYERKGALTSPGLNQVVAFAHLNDSDSNKELPDIVIYFAGLTANCSATGFGYSCPSDHPIIRMSPTLLNPRSRGYVELATSNPFDNPRIVYNYFSNIDDLKLEINGARFVEKFTNTTSMRALGTKIYYDFIDDIAKPCTTFKRGSDDYWGCVTRQITYPENHQMSTCHMGPDSDDTAVVTDRLLVRHVSNLRVIDASVFPFVMSGSISAIVIMAAEKGSDYIKEDWKKKQSK